MKPSEIENLRIHLMSPTGNACVQWEHRDRRYHVWMNGGAFDDVIHSNPIEEIKGARGHNQHRTLNMVAKKYDALFEHLKSFATPERIAASRQARIDHEEEVRLAAEKRRADKIRAAVHGQADLFIIAHNDDLASALREIADGMDDDDLIRLSCALRA